jgi:RNA polymerase sigma-70 factor (ECF subfamily)
VSEEPDRGRRLIEHAREGDRRALEEIYLANVDRVYAYIAASVRNRHDAEDLTIQTFLRMLESIDRFEWRDIPISAWLFRIAQNVLRDHFRAVRREYLVAEAVRVRGREEIPEIEIDPLGQLIGTLPETQRRVLALKYHLDLSNAEVATVLGKSEGAVKALQSRAFATLRS